jgi:hypothetical protein
MHADLVKLLDLQAKDMAVEEVEARMRKLDAESAGLDQVLQRARDLLEAARRAVADGVRRRDELEARVESFRLLQERRQLRLEHVRNPKEASTLMAELDLARTVMSKEENDWLRSAEAVGALEAKVGEEERKVDAVVAEPRSPVSGTPRCRSARRAPRGSTARSGPATIGSGAPARPTWWCRWWGEPAAPVTP